MVSKPEAAKVNNSTDDTLGIYYAQNIAAGANTVTVSLSSAASLRFAILEDGEVRGGEIGYRFPVPIEHAHIDGNDGRAAAEDLRALRLRAEHDGRAHRQDHKMHMKTEGLEGYFGSAQSSLQFFTLHV